MATENRLKSLPDIDQLKSLCQSLAMLDAIMSPDWEYRYYSFDTKWGLNEMMASMRNGQGDDFFILFDDNGAIIKGFDHESPMSPYASEPKRVWPGVLDDVPDIFQGFLDEPAFAVVEYIYKHQQLTDEIIASLNPDVSLTDLKADIENIGYSQNAA